MTSPPPPFVDDRDEAIFIMLNNPSGEPSAMFVLESLAGSLQEGRYNWTQTGAYRTKGGRQYVEFKRIGESDLDQTREDRAVPDFDDDRGNES